jgi:hypothetical protein
MPIILATWEAVIERTTVRGQPGQIVHQTPSQNNKNRMHWRCGSSDTALQAQNSANVSSTKK